MDESLPLVLARRLIRQIGMLVLTFPRLVPRGGERMVQFRNAGFENPLELLALGFARRIARWTVISADYANSFTLDNGCERAETWRPSGSSRGEHMVVNRSAVGTPKMARTAAVILAAAALFVPLAWAEPVEGFACLLPAGSAAAGAKVLNASGATITGLNLTIFSADGSQKTVQVPDVASKHISEAVLTLPSGGPVVAVVHGPQGTVHGNAVVDDIRFTPTNVINCSGGQQTAVQAEYDLDSRVLSRIRPVDNRPNADAVDTGPLAVPSSAGTTLQVCEWDGLGRTRDILLADSDDSGNTSTTSFSLPGGQIGCATVSVPSDFHLSISPPDLLHIVILPDRQLHNPDLCTIRNDAARNRPETCRD